MVKKPNIFTKNILNKTWLSYFCLITFMLSLGMHACMLLYLVVSAWWFMLPLSMHACMHAFKRIREEGVFFLLRLSYVVFIM